MLVALVRSYHISGTKLRVNVIFSFQKGQNTNICFFEAMIQFALNGFEVNSVDSKGFGYSSGTRAGGFIL